MISGRLPYFPGTLASDQVRNQLATAVLGIIVALHAVPPGLRISVWDVGPGHPAPADAGPSAETGRGLTIIDALTHSNWGWWPTPRSGGKVVHATLTVPAS